MGLRLYRRRQPRCDVVGSDRVFAMGRDVVSADVGGHGGPGWGQEGAIEPGAGVRDPGHQKPGEGLVEGFGEALGTLVLRVPQQVTVSARFLRWGLERR